MLNKLMVGAIGFEPTTPCAQGLAARGINKLHRASLIVTECYGCLVPQGFSPIREHSVTLGMAWWWAQNWALCRGVNPYAETIYDWHTRR